MSEDPNTPTPTEPTADMKPILEAALMAAGKPLNIDQLCDLFVINRDDELQADKERRAFRKPVRSSLKALQRDCDDRGVELVEVASGFRFQVKQAIAVQVAHLWANRPSRYSRAMLETLALIAYRQPITRGEIEKIRGVSVSSDIMKKLLDFGWIRIVGHRNTPGKPRLYGTTKVFLDHFSLKNLEALPPLQALRDEALESEKQLNDEEFAQSKAQMEESTIQADLPLDEEAEHAEAPVVVEDATPAEPELTAEEKMTQKILEQWPTEPRQVGEDEDSEMEADRGLALPAQLLPDIDPDTLSFDDEDEI